MENYHTVKLILEFLTSILWPATVLIVFYWLKNPIINIINNIKKFTYGNTGIETTFENKQNDKSTTIDLLNDSNDFSDIDKILSKFSNSSVEYSGEIIENETKISEVENIQNKYERIYKYSKLLILIKSAEKIYHSIYGSQIRILQSLNYSISQNSADVKFYYDNAVKYYPEIFQNYSYENYLTFLSSWGLIIIEDDFKKLTITDAGKDLLRYIVEANLSFDKKY